jgi:ketosteroid isomerase-like protein
MVRPASHPLELPKESSWTRHSPGTRDAEDPSRTRSASRCKRQCTYARRLPDDGLRRVFRAVSFSEFMGAEENKQVVRRQFEFLNAGNIEGATALWAAEGFNHGRKVDPAGVKKVYESLRTLHEHHTLHELIAEGDWVAVRTTCSGAHLASPTIPVNSGIFSNVEPTGRAYQVQHIHLFKIVNGKITEHWANRDDLGAATQVGFILRPSLN